MRKLALLLLLTGCARTPSPWEKVGVRVVDGVPQLGEVEIGLERTECYGWCPAYSVKLCGDGTLTYTGNSFVMTKGEHFDKFDPQKLLPLLERFAELQFLSRKHECSVMVVDNPHALLSLRIGPRSGKVEDVGCSQSFEGWFDPVPSHVDWHVHACRLEEAIDAVANTEFWIGTPAERSEHRGEWR